MDNLWFSFSEEYPSAGIMIGFSVMNAGFLPAESATGVNHRAMTRDKI
jgi:hypothetical protein